MITEFNCSMIGICEAIVSTIEIKHSWSEEAIYISLAPGTILRIGLRHILRPKEYFGWKHNIIYRQKAGLRHAPGHLGVINDATAIFTVVEPVLGLAQPFSENFPSAGFRKLNHATVNEVPFFA